MVLKIGHLGQPRLVQTTALTFFFLLVHSLSGPVDCLLLRGERSGSAQSLLPQERLRHLSLPFEHSQGALPRHGSHPSNNSNKREENNAAETHTTVNPAQTTFREPSFLLTVAPTPQPVSAPTPDPTTAPSVALIISPSMEQQTQVASAPTVSPTYAPTYPYPLTDKQVKDEQVLTTTTRCPNSLPPNARRAPQVLEYQYNLFMQFGRSAEIAAGYVERQIQRNLTATFLDCNYDDSPVTSFFDLSGTSTAPIDELVADGAECSGVVGSQCYRVRGGLTLDLFYLEDGPVRRALQDGAETPETLQEIVDFRIVEMWGPYLDDLFDSGYLRGPYTEEIMGMDFFGFSNIAGGSSGTYAAGEPAPSDVAAVQGAFRNMPGDGTRAPIILSTLALCAAAVVLAAVVMIGLRRRRDNHIGGGNNNTGGARTKGFDETYMEPYTPSPNKERYMEEEKQPEGHEAVWADHMYDMEADVEVLSDQMMYREEVQQSEEELFPEPVFSDSDIDSASPAPRFITGRSSDSLSGITPDRSYGVSDTVNL